MTHADNTRVLASHDADFKNEWLRGMAVSLPIAMQVVPALAVLAVLTSSSAW